jgi:hypothetical protein
MSTTSPFVVGAKVIKVRHGRFGGEASYTTATIKTVWKNGKFFLDGDYDQKGWSAGCRDGQWYASQKDYNAPTLYMADDALVIKQRDEARARKDAANKFSDLRDRLSRRQSSWELTPEQLAAVEAALAVFPESK